MVARPAVRRLPAPAASPGVARPSVRGWRPSPRFRRPSTRFRRPLPWSRRPSCQFHATVGGNRAGRVV